MGEKVIINCKVCERRLFDTSVGTIGMIEIKCPKCRRVVSTCMGKDKTGKWTYTQKSYKVAT